MALPRLIVTPLFIRLISTKGTEGHYEGDVNEEGEAHGRGKWTTLKDHIYVGEFVKNKKHGEGTYTWKDARVRYVGKWRDDERHGYGTQTYVGSTYEGEWEGGNRHGRGKDTWTDGSVYDGEWLFDRKHGMGTLVDSRDAKYVGQFVSNMKSGEGTLTQKNGYQYVGGWLNDMKNGKAKVTWRNGRVFEGYFEYNQTTRGTMTFHSTNPIQKYDGEWANHKINGYGSALFLDHSSYKGFWKNGEMDGKGKMVMPCGAIYRGNFEMGKRSGHGHLTHTCGSTYVGTFKDGKRHGEGIHTLPNGDRYEGGFRDDKIYGRGRLFCNTGENAGKVFTGYTPLGGSFHPYYSTVSGSEGCDGVDGGSSVVSTMDSAASVGGNATYISVDSTIPCPVVTEPVDGRDKMVKRRMEEMERKLKELENEKLCDVCFVSPKAVHFLPCNHVCCCDTCATMVEKCPICRKQITDRVPSFRS